LAHASTLWVFLVDVLFKKGGVVEDQAALAARDAGCDFHAVAVAQVALELLCAAEGLAAKPTADGTWRRLVYITPVFNQLFVAEKLGAAVLASDVGLLSHPSSLGHGSPQ
jgi:hypothetical protein